MRKYLFYIHVYIYILTLTLGKMDLITLKLVFLKVFDILNKATHFLSTLFFQLIKHRRALAPI